MTLIVISDSPPKTINSALKPHSRTSIPTIASDVLIPHLQEPNMEALVRVRASCDVAQSLLESQSVEDPIAAHEPARLALEHLKLASWLLPVLKKGAEQTSLGQEVLALETSSRLWWSANGVGSLQDIVEEDLKRPAPLNGLLKLVLNTVTSNDRSKEAERVKELAVVLPKFPRHLQIPLAQFVSEWGATMGERLAPDTVLALIGASVTTGIPQISPLTQEDLERRARTLMDDGDYADAYTLWSRVTGREHEAVQCLVFLRRFEEAARLFEVQDDLPSAVEAWRQVPHPEEALRVARLCNSELVSTLETVTRLHQALSRELTTKLMPAERRELLRLLGSERRT